MALARSTRSFCSGDRAGTSPRICWKTEPTSLRRSDCSPASSSRLSRTCPRRPGRRGRSHFGERLGVDDELLVGGGIEVGRGLVEVLDHVKLDEHAAQFGDDFALLLECGLLLGAGSGRVLGGLGGGGGFEVIEDLLDLVVREVAQALRDLFEHLALGGRREPLEGQDVDGGTGPAGGLIDPRLDLLLLVALLGRDRGPGKRRGERSPRRAVRRPGSGFGVRQALAGSLGVGVGSGRDNPVSISSISNGFRMFATRNRLRVTGAASNSVARPVPKSHFPFGRKTSLWSLAMSWSLSRRRWRASLRAGTWRPGHRPRT